MHKGPGSNPTTGRFRNEGRVNMQNKKEEKAESVECIFLLFIVYVTNHLNSPVTYVTL